MKLIKSLSALILLIIGIQLCIVSPLMGQKVKVKKGVIYIDDEPTVTIKESSEKSLKSWAFCTMEGDTFMIYSGKTVRLPQLPHEERAMFYPHYEIYFPKTNVKSYTNYWFVGFKKSMGKAIVRNGLFVDGKYNIDAEKAYVEKHNSFQAVITRLKDATEHRDTLKDSKSYQFYAKDIIKRTPTLNGKAVVNDNGKIVYAEKIIGQISYKGDEKGITFSVIFPHKSAFDPIKRVGTIFFEKETKKVVIKTKQDNAERAYHSEKGYNDAELDKAIFYLIEHAYL